ncbi:unnamed protein product, partial [Ectocarpus sp. 12 AP-2014]
GSITLNPGESQEYTVTYAPDLDTENLGYQEASLSIISNDDLNPTFDIGLHALKKAGGSGQNEPALQDVVDALGIGIDVGWTTLTNTTSAELQGEEVDVSLWVKATEAPINVTPVGRYSPGELLPFGWYTENNGEIVLNEVGVLDEGATNAQTLFPPIVSGDGLFDPLGAVFGFYVRSNFFNRTNYTGDLLNNGDIRRARVYPISDRIGNPVENSYLITFEDANNGDYQDYMFIIDNVIPFEDGSLVLNFDNDNFEFEAAIGQADIPTQELTISANTGISASEIVLTGSEPWIVLPETFEMNTPFDVGVDITGLPVGSYDATISASA